MSPGEVSSRLNALLAAYGLSTLDPETSARFEAYLSLFMRWNGRLNLSSIRDVEGILTRHFVESIAVAQLIPQGTGTLLDFGSGAGLPGIPIALCRPEIAVTLAESQNKKAAFLQEAVRVLGVNIAIHARRAEELSTVFDCVTLRAVDKMPKAVTSAIKLIKPDGYLALITTADGFPLLRSMSGSGVVWHDPKSLPVGVQRILVIGRLKPRA